MSWVPFERANSLTKPEDKPCEERGAGVKDTVGNAWSIRYALEFTLN